MTITRPALSFIIPAHDAAATIAATLDSLLLQTRGDWEAVVVDDGSADVTPSIVARYAQKDARIRLLHRPQGGASLARNTGLEAATAAHIAFLDADDWVAPAYVERMLGALEHAPEADIAYCSYRRVLPDGRMLPVKWTEPLAERAAHLFARHQCAAAIHCFVALRASILAVGGYDGSLETCEDWDLWLRLARTGARYAEVPECLAFYRLGSGSLSSRLPLMVRNAIEVAQRAVRPDPRIPHPPAAYADGMDVDPAQTAVYFAVWCAAVQAARGGDGSELLDLLPGIPDLQNGVVPIVQSIADGLSIGFGQPLENLHDHVASWQAPIARLLRRLSAHSSQHDLAFACWICLADQIVPDGVAPYACSIGPVFLIQVDIAAIPTVVPPAGIDTLRLAVVASRQVVLPRLLIPLWGSLAPVDLVEIMMIEAVGLKEIIRQGRYHARARFWLACAVRSTERLGLAVQILRHRGSRRHHLRQLVKAVLRAGLLDTQPKSALTTPRSIDQVSALVEQLRRSAGAECLPLPTKSSPGANVGVPGLDRQAFWETLFASPDPWHYGSSYERTKYEHTLSLLPAKPIARALELACAEGHFTVSLAPKVGHLIAADIAKNALSRAQARCRGLGNVEFVQLDLIKDELPQGQDLIVCSEVLYYLEDRLELGRIAAKLAAALAPGGYLLTAHPNLLVDEVGRTGFDWQHAFGVATIARTFAQTPGLQLERAIETELYRICLFRRDAAGEAVLTPQIETAAHGELDPEVARHVVWGGAVVRRADAWARETTRQIPVLMYHRITEDGPAAIARYRTSPAAFEAQMRLLRRHGYYAITSPDLIEHMQARRPLRGRPVMITFDDGYRDFADTAWPILKRHDLCAEVFVATGKVGGTADWDADCGPPAPLMSWEDLCFLHAEGVRFGSHLATHRRADFMSSEDLLVEAAGSRAALEAQLGTEVRSLAAPYGSYDDRLIPILATCGYVLAFSTENRCACLEDHPLYVPRIEVHNGMNLAALAVAIGIVEP